MSGRTPEVLYSEEGAWEVCTPQYPSGLFSNPGFCPPEAQDFGTAMPWRGIYVLYHGSGKSLWISESSDRCRLDITESMQIIYIAKHSFNLFRASVV